MKEESIGGMWIETKGNIHFPIPIRRPEQTKQGGYLSKDRSLGRRPSLEIRPPRRARSARGWSPQRNREETEFGGQGRQRRGQTARPANGRRRRGQHTRAAHAANTPGKPDAKTQKADRPGSQETFPAFERATNKRNLRPSVCVLRCCRLLYL